MNMFIDKQKGMTLVELMVAVTIGLIVSAAVAGLFLQTTSSNNQNDAIGYIQDNGRYALKIIADDLEMSNFWAGLSASNSGGIQTDNVAIAQNGGSATIVATIDTSVNGCSASTANWNYDFANPIQYLISVDKTTAVGTFPCIDNADNSLLFVDGRNVLMVKRTKGLEESSGQVNGRPYIRSNRNVATVHKYVSGAPPTGTDAPPSGFYDWQYLTHIYYIAQDDPNLVACPNNSCPPKLVRQVLKEDSATPGNDPIYVTEELAEGIEGFHIMYGIDTDADAVADTFTSTPTNAQLGNAINAKVYVVARSKTEITGYTNDKTYVIGDITPWTPGDGYYRRVFSTTVVMKNTEAVVQMNCTSC